MPGSVQNTAPATVLPQSLSRAFARSQEYPVIENKYQNGESQRPVPVNNSSKRWRPAKRLQTALLRALRDFYEARGGPAEPFYFYDPYETNPKFSWDPTGVATTIGCTFENLAKYSEEFSVGIWDKNGGSCPVTANSIAAPDGSTTADTVTASTATPIIQPREGWKVSLAMVNNAYGAYLAGPTQITLTAAWQRFRITGTLAGGQTGLWIVVCQYDSNGDDYTPSPFCILDEVDAPLDEPNIQRLMGLLKEMASHTQFIVITHAKRTMEAAASLYGVTMQEPGVSKLVSVRFNPPPAPVVSTTTAIHA